MNWLDAAVTLEQRIGVLRSFAVITHQDWLDWDWFDVVFGLCAVHGYMTGGRDSMVNDGLGPDPFLDTALRINGFEVPE